MDKRQRMLQALEMVLTKIIERKMDDVPLMFKPFLAKVDLSPASLIGSIQDTLTEDDWTQLEALFE